VLACLIRAKGAEISKRDMRKKVLWEGGTVAMREPSPHAEILGKEKRGRTSIPHRGRKSEEDLEISKTFRHAQKPFPLFKVTGPLAW